MQRALGAALKTLKKEFEGKHETLKKESRVLRMARALDEEMSMEQIGKLFGTMLKASDTSTDAKIRLLKIAKDLASVADDTAAEHDLAKVEFDDLRAALFESALEMLTSDDSFFMSLAYQMFQKKPELWEQLQENPPDCQTINVKVLDAP